MIGFVCSANLGDAYLVGEWLPSNLRASSPPLRVTYSNRNSIKAKLDLHLHSFVYGCRCLQLVLVYSGKDSLLASVARAVS